ncbi:hypothetical protein O6R05_06305 [Peptoniphilus equinus]|uniref:ApeA N-terminal domain-containing protein n=1 Tax=Peptoniphilus equinus TaxID=3016343 RepID=A0ABY7QTD4_9FIRM|nr:HEPN domain-containing protein [Peptoniphilus equinus]WBW49606.1 hypothetical protein O6R05_06305 [Peptoniphilus equinus]
MERSIEPVFIKNDNFKGTSAFINTQDPDDIYLIIAFEGRDRDDEPWGAGTPVIQLTSPNLHVITCFEGKFRTVQWDFQWDYWLKMQKVHYYPKYLLEGVYDHAGRAKSRRCVLNMSDVLPWLGKSIFKERRGGIWIDAEQQVEIFHLKGLDLEIAFGGKRSADNAETMQSHVDVRFIFKQKTGLQDIERHIRQFTRFLHLCLRNRLPYVRTVDLDFDETKTLTGGSKRLYINAINDFSKTASPRQDTVLSLEDFGPAFAPIYNHWMDKYDRMAFSMDKYLYASFTSGLRADTIYRELMAALEGLYRTLHRTETPEGKSAKRRISRRPISLRYILKDILQTFETIERRLGKDGMNQFLTYSVNTRNLYTHFTDTNQEVFLRSDLPSINEFLQELFVNYALVCLGFAPKRCPVAKLESMVQLLEKNGLLTKKED